MAEDTRDSLSLSDDENDDDIDDEYHLPELAGTLCKWTNYIHGWQDRYIVLKDGTLSYYKSETETSFGCRGAVSLTKAIITPHEFDDCRFDVGVNDCCWYLRARSAEDKQQWIDILDLQRQADSGYGSENGLRRHGSMLSLTSAASLSTASAGSFKKGRGLREKLAEMETFRDILCRQVDTLQSYFDACASVIVERTVHDLATDDIDDPEDLDSLHKNGTPNGHTPPHSNGFPAPVHHHIHHHSNSSSDNTPPNFMDLDDDRENKDIVNILQQHGAHAIDFKGEAFTFKATTAGILATLSHCIDLMMQREEAWRKRLEKETEKNKKMKEAYKSLLSGRPKTVMIGGPDFEEGPHSIMHEEEFFDAVDATLDKLDREEEKKKTFTSAAVKKEKSLVKPKISQDPSIEQFALIDKVVKEHLDHADMSAKDISSTWMLVAEDGEMKVYKRELEENGMVIDPLKAVHTVKGMTGHELCHYFWDPAVRMEWEGTLDSSTVVDWLSKETVVTHQVHKRVWPATTRDSLFWSNIRHVPGENEDSPDFWAVVNHSTEHSDLPLQSKCVRIHFNVAMICQTVVQPPKTGSDITRDSLTCRIQYTANVNPGGWAPASVVRVISKRELPKFLKTFTTYVQQKTKGQPIMF